MKRTRSRFGFSAAVFLYLSGWIGSSVRAQPLELAADLFPSGPGSGGVIRPDPVPVGDWVVFEAQGQLWATDGTPSGTYGLATSGSASFGGPAAITATDGDTIYWFRDPSSEPLPQLWSARLGARRSARRLALDLEFRPFFAVQDMVALDGALYFSAFGDGVFGIHVLHRGAGPPRLLHEMVRFPSPTFPPELEELGGQILFLSTEGPSIPGLWRTDGTVEGTERLVSFGRRGQAPPGGLTRVRDRVFFRADTGDGPEVWVSDGTAAGTRPVTSFRSFLAFRSVEPFLRDEGGKAYFLAWTPQLGEELWVSDGTEAGTGPVTSLVPEFPFADRSTLQTFQSLSDRILFVAHGDSSRRLELWSTDGDPVSTAPLVTGPDAPRISSLDPRLLKGDGRIFFLGDPEIGVDNVWTSDGSEAGTVALETFCPDCGQQLEGLATVGGEAFFVSYNRAGRRVLWASDGTAAGTRILMNPQRPTDGEPVGGPDPWIVGLGDDYVLGAENERHGQELWTLRRDGGASLLLDIVGDSAGSVPRSFHRFGGDLVFLGEVPETFGSRLSILRLEAGTTLPRPLLENPPWAEGIQDVEFLRSSGSRIFLKPRFDALLWRTDGTLGGSSVVWERDFELPRPLGFAGDTFLFSPESFEGCEIWAVDGTAAQASHITTLSDLTCQVQPGGGGGGATVFFVDLSDGTRQVLWSDGTPAGTEVLATDTSGDSSAFSMPRASALGGEIFFLWGQGLWKTSGTASSTRRLASFPCCESTSPMVELGGKLFFRVENSNVDPTLWRTDGTSAGTQAVATYPHLGGSSAEILKLVASHGRLYFVAGASEHGKELWTSDGTAAGTVLAADLYPGSPSSSPQGLTDVGGQLFFSATDPHFGRELWTLEGTGASPRRVQDLNPGIADGLRNELVSFDGSLWLTGTDGLRGRELWRLPVAEPGSECRPGPERLCLRGGRFAVEARWKDFQERRGAGQAVPLTEDTGYFWFFDEDNVEAILKILDGRTSNDHFWTFYGALSNVEYSLTVRDTVTGAARRYFNPSRSFASVGDTLSFGPLGAGSEAALAGALEAAPGLDPVVTASFDASAVGQPCVPGSTRLCLQGGRFAVEARWTDFRGNSGAGQAVDLTDDTGYFWFFRDTNVETVLKVLDGRPTNGNFWVFYGALSNVDYDLTVTDCETGAVRTYQNRNRTFASVGDTMAFEGS